MSESVVPDLVAFAIKSRSHIRKFIRLDADQEKCRRGVFFFQNVENLRGPLRVRSVIEGKRDLVRAVAVARDAVRLGQRIEILIGDLLRIFVNSEFASAVERLGLNAQDLALP